MSVASLMREIAALRVTQATVRAVTSELAAGAGAGGGGRTHVLPVAVANAAAATPADFEALVRALPASFKVNAQLVRALVAAVVRSEHTSGDAHDYGATVDSVCVNLLVRITDARQATATRCDIVNRRAHAARDLQRRAQLVTSSPVEKTRVSHVAANAALRALADADRLAGSVPSVTADVAAACQCALDTLEACPVAKSVVVTEQLQRVRAAARMQSQPVGVVSLPTLLQLRQHKWRRANALVLRDLMSTLLLGDFTSTNEHTAALQTAIADYRTHSTDAERATVASLAHNACTPLEAACWLAVLDAPHGLSALAELAASASQRLADTRAPQLAPLARAAARCFFDAHAQTTVFPRRALSHLAAATAHEAHTTSLDDIFVAAASLHQRVAHARKASDGSKPIAPAMAPSMPLMKLYRDAQRLDLDLHGCSVAFALPVVRWVVRRLTSAHVKTDNANNTSSLVRMHVHATPVPGVAGARFLTLAGRDACVLLSEHAPTASAGAASDADIVCVHSIRVHTGYGSRHVALLRDAPVDHTSALRASLLEEWNRRPATGSARASASERDPVVQLVPHNTGAFDIILGALVRRAL